MSKNYTGRDNDKTQANGLTEAEEYLVDYVTQVLVPKYTTADKILSRMVVEFLDNESNKIKELDGGLALWLSEKLEEKITDEHAWMARKIIRKLSGKANQYQW